MNMNEVIHLAYELAISKVDEDGATAPEIVESVCDGVVERCGDGTAVTEIGLRTIGVFIASCHASHYDIHIDHFEADEKLSDVMWDALGEYGGTRS